MFWCLVLSRSLFETLRTVEHCEVTRFANNAVKLTSRQTMHHMVAALLKLENMLL
jgi:hypothetical protein